MTRQPPGPKYHRRSPAAPGASAAEQAATVWAAGRRRRLITATGVAIAVGCTGWWLLSWKAAVLAALLAAAAVLWRARRTRGDAWAWRRGAAGERRTARILARLQRHGYRLLHDRAIPGSRANIDHIAIGPAGIIVVDSKRLDRRTSVRGRSGRVWIGGRTAESLVQPLLWETTRVREALDDARIPVRPVVAVHGGQLPRWGAPLTVSGVPILRARRVPDWITQQPAVTPPATITDLTNHLDACFPPYLP